ncbi:MAG: chemotaxis protein CheA [Candidatus Hydrogenedentes bacterium]|nr:chemotaxis protein CheA [Candidatus Hydrogenedentota bacterium]
MDTTEVLGRIETLTQGLLLADAVDLDVFARAHTEFTDFSAWCDNQGMPDAARALGAVCGLIERLILHEVADPTDASSTISRCLCAFQTLVRDGRPFREANFPPELLGGPTGALAQPDTSLPATDNGLLSEFLAHAGSVIAEIEPQIVIAERAPSPQIVSQIRREFHTMKAESALVGLDELSAVLHTTEDAMERGGDHALPQGLLDVVDWVKHYVQSRQGRGTAAGSPDEILAKLTVRASLEQSGEADTSVPPPKALDADPDLLREFVSEAREHLDNADVQLLNVETNPNNSDALNAVFRAFHTIKGVAGFLALDDVQALAHESENLLDKARKGEVVLTGNYIDVTFDAVDMMKRLIAHVECALAGGLLEGEVGLPPLVERLKRIGAGKMPLQPGAAFGAVAGRKRVGEILESEGAVTHTAVESALAKQARSESLRLGELLIREVVISRKQMEQALALQEREGYSRKLGEVLMSQGMARSDDIEKALRKQAAREAEPVGATLVRAGEVSAKEVAQALRSQRQQQVPVEVKEAVKVDAERLDKLIDLIGELVIAESMVAQSGELARSASQQLLRQISQLDKITRELQEMGMSLRMVPVRATFQKMSRLVRDLAKKSGKQVEFVTEGDDTELDKTVVDKIGDPLVHMVRNAVDHGLEASAADRAAVGKPASGRVTLRAFHKSGSIYIEIQDDGRGLDRDAILAKGRERGLVRDGEVLADREIFGLIFEPGFSTAKQVTDVSGRGVGMDVVRRNIESLRGQVEIQSTPGKGTIFSIRLPLTLAIIDGMVIRVGRERYIVPTLSVLRSTKPEREQLRTVTDRGEMLAMQGQLIPLFRLHGLFDIAGAQTDPLNAIVLILEEEGRQMGLMVDELLGQQQIVIKSLGDAMKGVPGVAGGAIMGDGTVGLIIDVSGVVRLAQSATPLQCKSAA